MKAYLVGGAVRDMVLGLPVTERDWVVVGETVASMSARGFRLVGKDFPVFLHPHTQEEYALARTERKIGPGYKGFSVMSEPNVTLEQDLLRRDLTINAMALDHNGDLIDPYGGAKDIAARQLRHVSSAFADDPVRVLRVARFSARFAHLGFKVSPETQVLMCNMVRTGEVDTLVPERVLLELVKALKERTPAIFFYVLRDCYALSRLFPELDQLFGVPQPFPHHPEIDAGVHTLMSLTQASALSNDPIIRFAVLTHDLGKGLTHPASWPRHIGHEKKGLPVLESLCNRLKIPNTYRQIAYRVMRYHTHCHRALYLRPGTLVDLFQRLDAIRRRNIFESFLVACEADARGRPGWENRPYLQADWMRKALSVSLEVSSTPFTEQGIQGTRLGTTLRQARIESVRKARLEYSPCYYV